MKCSWEEGALLAYSAHKLETSRAAALERHLPSCAACREFVAAQRAVWETLEAWEVPAVSADFDRRLYLRIEQERIQTAWWERWLRPLVVHRALPVAVAACLVVVVGLVFVERPSGTPAPQPKSAQVEALQPDQVDHAFDDMDMLSEFTRAVPPDTGKL